MSGKATDTGRAHYVYRFTAGSGVVLYVGCTANLGKRLHEHSRKDWWRDVALVEAVQYPDYLTAMAAEAEQIKMHDPVHNVVGTSHFPNAGGWAARRANPLNARKAVARAAGLHR